MSSIPTNVTPLPPAFQPSKIEPSSSRSPAYFDSSANRTDRSQLEHPYSHVINATASGSGGCAASHSRARVASRMGQLGAWAVHAAQASSGPRSALEGRHGSAAWQSRVGRTEVWTLTCGPSSMIDRARRIDPPEKKSDRPQKKICRSRPYAEAGGVGTLGQ